MTPPAKILSRSYVERAERLIDKVREKEEKRRLETFMDEAAEFALNLGSPESNPADEVFLTHTQTADDIIGGSF